MAFVLAFVGQDGWLSGWADAISGLPVGREAGATLAFVGRCGPSGHPSSLIITSETVALCTNELPPCPPQGWLSTPRAPGGGQR